ncbi:retinol dehydrogenase 13-like [Acanthaster planci]|uniref:Retinol dehydrogenase 13-like n=1 Tax=Acanthaster planci TaxID=133434 RepID=A0A8B7YYE0_ACAPL|nr:retinol dehydrogenase 13-like [Acanthaster planci]
MAFLYRLWKLLVPTLVVLYAVYYWHVIAGRRYFTGDVSLKGKMAIVTGANSGIGRLTALDFAQRGARVILACRNLQKAQDAAEEIKTRTGNSEVVVRHLDLASLQSVREFAGKIIESEERLDILVNNAGVYSIKSRTAVTVDNFDFVFGVNHFGHFLLTNLLLDLLSKSAPSRVVTLSSIANYYVKGQMNLTREDPSVASILYPHLEGYDISKVANILFGRELARREASRGVVSVSLHPGVIYTPIWKTFMDADSPLTGVLYHTLSPIMWLLFIDEEAGTQTTLHCALDDSVPDLSGSYFENCQETKPSALAQDDDLARRLWEVSCEATGLKCSRD